MARLFAHVFVNTVFDTLENVYIENWFKLGLRGQMGWKIANIVEMFSLHMNLFQFQIWQQVGGRKATFSQTIHTPDHIVTQSYSKNWVVQCSSVC